MGSKLIIEPEVQTEIDKAIKWYESKQVGLGADFFNYLDGYFQTLESQTIKGIKMVNSKNKYYNIDLLIYYYE